MQGHEKSSLEIVWTQLKYLFAMIKKDSLDIEKRQHSSRYPDLLRDEILTLFYEKDMKMESGFTESE